MLAAMTRANQEIIRLNNEVATLRAEMKKTETVLLDRTADLEWYTRWNNVRIYVVPETKGKTRMAWSCNYAERRLAEERAGEKPRHHTLVIYRDRRLTFNAK